MGFRDRLQKPSTIMLPDGIEDRLDETTPVAQPIRLPLTEDMPPGLELEVNARTTVIRMIVEAPKLDQEFSFNTTKYGGEAYVQAMRTTLSRVRADARKSKKQLAPFKLLLVKIEQLETHDRVTVVRTNKSSLKQKSVYDDIVAQLSGLPGKDE